MLAPATAIALGAAPMTAQQYEGGAEGEGATELPSDERAYEADGDAQAAESDRTALEAAVLEELESIGVGNLTVEKLSSGQLAGILMTLTATDRQDKEEAVTTIAADQTYQPGEIAPESVAGNEAVRETLAEALARAGWSTDISQLDDTQVAALYAVLARAGDLSDEKRIRDVLQE